MGKRGEKLANGGQMASGDLSIPADILAQTEQRYRSTLSGMQAGKAAASVETLLSQNAMEAVTSRLRRLGVPEPKAVRAASFISEGKARIEGFVESPSPLVAPELPEEVVIGLERILGNNDLMSIRFLDMGSATGRSIGRVVIRKPGGGLAGYGTGFMVSPQLLLTNNHVLASAEEAAASQIEFNYQDGLQGELLEAVCFTLAPDAFFLTDRTLDFTLVAVGKPVDGAADLDAFGWNRLSDQSGEILVGEYVNIIQHPNGERKQLALRENKVTAISEERFLQYQTDTAPGSSGSPVLNDQWEVVALHHSGVPERDGQGNILARDRSLWKAWMGEHRIRWIANEGVRIPAILAFVKDQRLDDAQRKLRTQLLEGEKPREPGHREEATGKPASKGTPALSHVSAGEAVWTIPLQISIRLGTGPTIVGAAAAASPGEPPATQDETGDWRAAASEAVNIDPDYRSRKGYNPDFLGQGSRRVPVPKMSAELAATAAVNRWAEDGDDPHLLPYHHFSVVMNAARRLACFTAVNIDGKKSYRIKRERDHWYFDPRIRRAEQAGEEVYRRNALDRGHLVRRLDPAWGASEDTAKVANDDTFHFTNCSPQHQDFNQNDTTWAGLEDYILDNAIANDFKVSVFTGPVFDDRDDEYRGIQLPRQFWKVVAMVKDDGRLSATAYLLSQTRLLRGELEGFAYGAYRTFQVPIRKIEDLTGLDFGNLSSFDPSERVEALGVEGLAAREIAAYEDLVL
jgi:endonuclease G